MPRRPYNGFCGDGELKKIDNKINNKLIMLFFQLNFIIVNCI